MGKGRPLYALTKTSYYSVRGRTLTLTGLRLWEALGLVVASKKVALHFNAHGRQVKPIVAQLRTCRNKRRLQ